MVSEGFPNFIAKEDGLANSRDVNPLETIWIIVDETTYKGPGARFSKVPIINGPGKLVSFSLRSWFQ